MAARLLVAALASTMALWSSCRAGWFDWFKSVEDRALEQQTKGRTERSGTSTAGVRGLGEDEGGGDKAARDYAALQWLDGLRVGDDDVSAFVKEGRLAP